MNLAISLVSKDQKIYHDYVAKLRRIMRRKIAVYIAVSALLSALALPGLIASSCSPLPTLSVPSGERNGTAEGDRGVSTRLDIVMDIFSGNPNPAWVLSEADGIVFLNRFTMLPKASAKELSNNLGYRGFIVQMTNGTEKSLIQIQNGTVQLSQGDTNVYYSDQDRDLERLLLNSGKSNLKSDLFQIVESELPKNQTSQPG